MTDTADLYQLTAPVKGEELDSALLDMTGDLDKARVLHSTLPGWMIQAPSHTLGALERAHASSQGPRRRLKELLAKLQPLDQFCAQKLQEYLASQGHPELDVRRDVLQRPRQDTVGVTYVTGLEVNTRSLETHSLVQAAMQNFSADEAEPDGLPATTEIRSGERKRVATGITPQQFVAYCRTLDLGSAYQAHVREVFSLPAPGEAPIGLSYNQAALAVGESKKVDMLIDLHIALAKQHISQATHARLLKLISFDLPASLVVESVPVEKRLTWQGLNIDEACLWSVLMFCEGTPVGLPAGAVTVYMPNEPVRPWYEYPSLEDFTQYLTLKLQVASYRKVFERYLDESERLDFFKHFDAHRKLGPLVAMPVLSNFSDFFFRACVGKLQLDAQVLAVPNAQVDADARRQRVLDYLNDGLDILNLAAFVVPVVGQLMMGVAVGQMLGDVFDGVEDWSHQHTAEALKHLISVAQNLGAMMLFAAGGKVVGTLKAKLGASTDFFEELEAVRLPDQRPRLWRPRLSAYSQPADLAQQWMADAHGMHQANGRSFVQIDGEVYRVSYDPAIRQWRVDHPQRPTAYRPSLTHNFKGGWQHEFERPEQWQHPLYIARRIDPGLMTLPSEALEHVAAINQTDLGELQRLQMAREPFPERFNDCVARVRQHHKVTDLAHALKQEHALDPGTARTQMLALPLMPTWPEGRYFELLDSAGNWLENHPDLAPFDYADQSIHITEQQLKDGRILETVLETLSEQERTTLLGEPATLADAPALLKRRLLETVQRRHRALYRKLYEDYNGTAQGDLLVLCKRFAQLPRRVAWELLSRAPSVERRYLRKTGRVPLALEQRSRAMVDALAEDQALMGLYWPPLAGAATRRVTFGLLGQLAHWPGDLLLQLREGSVTGQLLEQVGPSAASVSRTIVRNDQGFQAFDHQGADLNTRVSEPDGLLQTVVDCLSPAQRKAMALTGPHPVEGLRRQLRVKSGLQRKRLAGYLLPERGIALEEPLACGLAQMGAAVSANEFAPALVRKVKKLYPAMKPEQVSALLRNAGADHVSRANAVEALEKEFSALRHALKRWSSDRSAHDIEAEPLWDYRMSRYQARKAIERSWRGLSNLVGPQLQEVPGLALDGMVLGNLPTLPAQVRFGHLRMLSLRNMGLNDDTAYFLKHFTGLRALDLADNRLSRLPEALTLMPDLEYLRLARNRLSLTEQTRKKLGDMRQLQTLDLSRNPLLNAPDVSRQFDLRDLLLPDCQLKDFPVGVQSLPYLESVNLQENEIKELPAWLFDLRRESAQVFNLRRNPLSASSLQALTSYHRRVGPGMGVFGDDIARLNEQRAREIWLSDERVADFAEKDLAWTGLKNESGSDGLFKLLAQLGNTADATRARDDLARRVWRVVNATAAHAELREEVFDRAATPINCDDAASVNFSNLEILVEIREVSRLLEGGRLTARPLLKLAKGLFRLDRLASIANRHSLAHPEADPLEVSLAFRTGLANTFYLPGQPKRMLHEGLASVTQVDLNTAELELKTAELSPGMLKYIVELPFWKDYLKRTFASRFETLIDPFHRRMHGVFDQVLTLKDADYRDQMSKIHREQVQAEAAEIERLTHNAMRTDDLNLCEGPVS